MSSRYILNILSFFIYETEIFTEFLFYIDQEYGNIGYHSTRNQSVTLEDAETSTHEKSRDILNKKCDQMKPVVPIISIDLPD